jgi:hypothetical protein
MCTEVENLLCVLGRDSFPFRDVLAVDDEEIDVVLLDIVRNKRGSQFETRLTYDIADKEDVKGM